MAVIHHAWLWAVTSIQDAHTQTLVALFAFGLTIIAGLFRISYRMGQADQKLEDVSSRTGRIERLLDGREAPAEPQRQAKGRRT